jgi:hypothetical protein
MFPDYAVSSFVTGSAVSFTYESAVFAYIKVAAITKDIILCY